MKLDITIGKGNLHLRKGDITDMEVDAIVNAANERLILGSGVAGAIARRGGPEIQEECNRIGGTHVGGAVITGGGNLPARHVIHAVGPRRGEGDEDRKLRDATRNSMKVAEEHNLKSIAFPAISTGVFGFPLDHCAQIMLCEVKNYFEEGGSLSDIYFCLFDDASFRVFEMYLDELVQEV